MKILALTRQAGGDWTIDVGVDSAMLRTGEPVFIEEPAEAWRTEAASAVRISRLGSHIPLRHAGRYYDAVAAIHLLRPATPRTDGLPPLFCDRALAPGQWVPVGEDGADMTVEAFRTPLRGEGHTERFGPAMAATAASLGVDEAIAELSRTMTLKTGDILIFEDAAAYIGAPVIDSRIEATIGGKPSLSVKIK